LPARLGAEIGDFDRQSPNIGLDLMKTVCVFVVSVLLRVAQIIEARVCIVEAFVDGLEPLLDETSKEFRLRHAGLVYGRASGKYAERRR